MKSIKEELRSLVLKSREEAYYPPILEYDVASAASSMTIYDSEEALEKLTDTFNALQDDTTLVKYPVLARNILMSKANLTWFSSLVNELSKLIKHEEYEVTNTIKIRYQKKDRLLLFPPLAYKKGKVREQKLPDFLSTVIDKYRYLYIKNNLQIDDFRGGYPTWYLLTNMTLFERYNPMTNMRVKIDFDSGEFRYYISGASDNWKEIRDVPLEMDHVVSALLFRN